MPKKKSSTSPTQRSDAKECIRTAWRLITNADWPFEPEVRFHPVRRWRFDWANQEKKLAIELEGITHFGSAIGRHQSATGIEADMDKYNTAAELGWVVLRYSQRQVKEMPGEVIDQILRVAGTRASEARNPD